MPQRESRMRTTLYFGLLGLAALLLMATTGLSIFSSGELRESIQWVTHTREVLERSANVRTGIGDSEAFQRGFLLNGDELFLREYERAAANLDGELSTLQALVGDSPEQSQRVGALRQIMDRRFEFARDANRMALEGERSAAAARTTSAIPQAMAGRARYLVQQIELGERSVLDTRQRKMYRLLSQTSSTIIIANSLALVAGAIAFVMMRRSRAAWERQRLAELDATSARAASREKSSFVASMSHEIRTPMNAIFGFTQLLAQSVSNPRDRQFVRAIQTSGQSLLSLINDILDLSKIEAGRLDLEPQPTEIRDVVDGAITVFAQMAAEKHLELRADVNPGTPGNLLLDPNRLRQILFNLISNAVKYTESGSVKLRVWHEATAVEDRVDLHLLVRDTGIGISAAQIQQIFEPFVRARSGDGPVREGAGLGLTITKRLADLMGGVITVSSQRGKGSVFELVFRDIAVGSGTVRHPSAVWQDIDLDLLRPARILVVDDVAWNRDLLIGFFSGTRHRILLADSGAEALEIASREQLDVVLMDIRMPDMDGRETLRRLRTHANLRALAVVAVTASNLGSDGTDADLREDFAAYLRKPLSKFELFKVLLPLLGEAPGSQAREVPDADDSHPGASMEAMRPAAQARLNSMATDAWPRLRDTVAMRECAEFARELEQLARIVGNPNLSDYAGRLRWAVETFDVATVESLLHQFPEHLGPGMEQPAVATPQ